MPNLGLLGAAVLLSAAASGVVFLAVAAPWRNPRQWRAGVAWVLGLGAGFYVGSVLLGQWPRWPPAEDRDRLLAILLPLTLAVEFVAVFLPARWLAWILRLAVASSAAPILLYNTTYLADLSGPGSAEWPPAMAALILCTLAALLIGAWVACDRLQARKSERVLSSVLAVTSLAAAFCVMLSGYYRGGLLGLPLGAALCGTTIASYVSQRLLQCKTNADAPTKPISGSVGIGLIGLCYVLLVGRFFGSLPTSSALILLFAPLAAWIVEMPGLRKLRPSVRAAICVVVVAAPLCSVLTLAQMRFMEAWKAKSKPAGSASYTGTHQR